MTDKPNRKWAVVPCALLTVGIALTVSEAQAQSTEIEELRTRVAALEADDRNRATTFNIGDGTTVEVYGFVRFETFYDFDFAQGDLSRAGRVGEDAFATDGEFDTSVRVSRFGIRSATETGVGKVETQLEFDLFSGSETSTSPTLRLRHANIEIADALLFGQFWTNFMPLVHYPTTADFNGPVGVTFARVPQIRYTYNAGNGFTFSGSIEEAAGESSDPVVTAAALYRGENYSLRAAALAGTFNDGGTEYDTNGLTLSGSVSPWEGGTFSATYVTGEALGNLLIGGGDRVVGGVTNDADGFTLEFRQDIGEKWNVGLALGNESYDLASGGTGVAGDLNDFTDLRSLHLNAFYQPTDSLTYGIEYIYLESETSTGETFDANRIGASVTFAF
ncbi:porin [Sulfitobacter albidus]|uniref:Porin n=1 Tax=Sulfitobacter albidus TaxID=2829501 RepID=A0A975JEK6_9RHOB|nr:DcaP family trimeric outer membrane transporter [Sulfitobacter albidus]QUJ77062.1 porin [Sulfitobacter albidus]